MILDRRTTAGNVKPGSRAHRVPEASFPRSVGNLLHPGINPPRAPGMDPIAELAWSFG